MAKNITIGIGEYYASNEPSVIYTLLGSCVSVCLFDPVNHIGGMNHILLPGKADMKNYNNRARYGINAMELLINKMMNLGAERKYFIAKVFGGANVLPYFSREYHIGSKIVDFTRSFLLNERIEIKSYDFGGNKIRKIFFHTESGDVFLKKIVTSQLENVIKKEKMCLKKIRKEVNKTLRVELFD